MHGTFRIKLCEVVTLTFDLLILKWYWYIKFYLLCTNFNYTKSELSTSSFCSWVM